MQRVACHDKGCIDQQVAPCCSSSAPSATPYTKRHCLKCSGVVTYAQSTQHSLQSMSCAHRAEMKEASWQAVVKVQLPSKELQLGGDPGTCRLQQVRLLHAWWPGPDAAGHACTWGVSSSSLSDRFLTERLPRFVSRGSENQVPAPYSFLMPAFTAAACSSAQALAWCVLAPACRRRLAVSKPLVHMVTETGSVGDFVVHTQQLQHAAWPGALSSSWSKPNLTQATYSSDTSSMSTLFLRRYLHISGWLSACSLYVLSTQARWQAGTGNLLLLSDTQHGRQHACCKSAAPAQELEQVSLLPLVDVREQHSLRTCMHTLPQLNSCGCVGHAV